MGRRRAAACDGAGRRRAPASSQATENFSKDGVSSLPDALLLMHILFIRIHKVNQTLKRLTLLVLLLVLPLQTLAVAVMPVVCLSHDTHAVALASGVHQHDASTQHRHAGEMPADPEAAHDVLSQLCCHQVFSGAVFPQSVPGVRNLSLQIAYLPTIPAQYFPDPLRRPPRT